MKSLVGNGLDGTNEVFIPVAPKGARAPEGVHLLFHKVLASMSLRANVEGQNFCLASGTSILHKSCNCFNDCRYVYIPARQSMAENGTAAKAWLYSRKPVKRATNKSPCLADSAAKRWFPLKT